MRFKNYRNSYTKDNRIYSKQEMLDMTVREIKERANEFIAQHQVLGLPGEKELFGSSNVVWIDEYTRDDGTKVSGHWRSKPGEGSNTDTANIEYKDFDYENTDWDENPEGSENLYSSQKYEESEEYKKEYREREKQKSIERQDPDEIAGVKKGEPKTFYEMMQQGVNPNYRSQEDANDQYSTNCQSCNVACELVMRGYNVEANSYDNPVAHELAKTENSAYLDPITGEKCVPNEIDLERVDCSEYINETVKVEERYEFSFHITPKKDDFSSTDSHTVFLTRMDNDELLIYDGQDGNIAYGEKEVKSYVDSHVNDENTVFFPRLLRVDDKKVNPYYTNKVVRAGGKNRRF